MIHYGSIAEYWAAREKTVIMDLSPLRKYEVTGSDAEALMQPCIMRDMKKFRLAASSLPRCAINMVE